MACSFHPLSNRTHHNTNTYWSKRIVYSVPAWQQSKWHFFFLFAEKFHRLFCQKMIYGIWHHNGNSYFLSISIDKMNHTLDKNTQPTYSVVLVFLTLFHLATIYTVLLFLHIYTRTNSYFGLKRQSIKTRFDEKNQTKERFFFSSCKPNAIEAEKKI